MFGTKSGETFEGHEVISSVFKMNVKMHKNIILCLLLFQTLIFFVNCKVTATYETYVLGKYLAAKYINAASSRRPMSFMNEDGSTTRTTAKAIVKKTPWIEQAAFREMKRIGKNWLLLFGASAVFYPLILAFFSKKAKRQSSKRHLRGAKVISASEFLKRAEERKDPLDLPLGTIKMPVSLENRHTMIIGKPGTGKTQAMRPIIKRLYERKNQVIQYDNKGEYFSEFFNPKTDLLFNPLDQRSLGWNLFNELVSYPDVDAIAASLIPPSVSAENPFWTSAARGVFSGILHYLYQNNQRNNKELWKLLSADAQEIATKLKNTKGGEAGYRYITQNAENSRQAEGVLATLMQYTKCFEYMADNDGDFKIDSWLKKGRGIIYITNYEDIEETLRPILSLFVDLIGRKILSLTDDINRRIFINLDEFGSLQRLSTIVNLLTRGRSKGACVFIGIQDDGQTEKIYTPQTRKSIDNACGNRVTFGLTGETAEREARYNVGETEYMETERSMSMGPHDMRDGISLSERKKKDLLLLPSEIANLPDLTALVSLKNYDFVLSEWRWEAAKQLHEPFLLRSDLTMESIVASQVAAE